MGRIRRRRCRFAENHKNIVVQWNDAALEAVRGSSGLGPPAVARALAVVHTCMYDAWAAYDARALGTEFGQSLRRPKWERTLANKQIAISYAAYRALADLFPNATAPYQLMVRDLGYDPSNTSVDPRTPK